MSTPLWSGPRLLTPMTVDALVLGEPNLRSLTDDFAQAGVDYTQLRFNNSPTAQPFTAPGGVATPQVGVELHWTMPEGLRSGVTTDDGVVFPQVPNRWLIVRALTPSDADPDTPPTLTAWLLRSDIFDNSQGASPFPDPDSTIKYSLMGVSLQLDTSQSDPASTTPRLYSMGPGDAAFASVYQSIQNVLAFYDPMTDVPNATVSYTVMGYFNPTDWDPLLGVDVDGPQGFTSQDQWQQIIDQLRLQVGDGSATALSDAQADWQAWAAANGVDPSGLPSAQQDLPGQLLVFGSVQVLEWQGPEVLYENDNIPPSGGVDVAVGNTATEALGAWLGTQVPDRELEDYSIERLIEALMTDTLTTFMRDVVGFEFQLAATRFGSVSSGSQTVVTLPTSSNTSQTTVPLDAGQTAALTALNASEAQRDVLADAIESRQWELFAANWKLVKKPGDPTIEDAIASLTTQLETLEAAHDAALAEVAATTAALEGLLGSDYVTSIVPRDPYAAPADPVMLISSINSDDKLTQRNESSVPVDLDCRMSGQTLTGFTLDFDSTGAVELTTTELAASLDSSFLGNVLLPKEAQDLLLESLLLNPGVVPWLASEWLAVAAPDGDGPSLSDVEQAIEALQAGVRAAPALDPSLSATLLAELSGFSGTAPDPIANQDQAQPWTPIYLDWELVWHPNGATPQDALTDWQLGEIDLDWIEKHHKVPDASVTYVGRTLLNSDAPAVLAQRINTLLTQPDLDIPIFMRQDLQASAQVLATADVLTQSLAGFTDLLIQRQVAQATGNLGEGVAPEDATVPAPPTLTDESDRPFQPIRSGHFSISRLWVVDAWGQVLKSEVFGGSVIPIRSESVVTPGGTTNQAFVQLPPRLSQSAHLDLQLVDASAPAPAPPSNSSDSTSPIAGYLAPNHLDGGLLVYDSEGKVLGELLPIVKDSGSGLRWEAAPGLEQPLGSPPQIDNQHLQALVEGILDRAEQGVDALGELLDLMDGVTYMTNPDWAAGSDLSVLIGEPLAVVRATVQLQLDGDPVYDQAYDNTGKRVTDDFTTVDFPLRIGDLGLSSNGVVGYYIDDEYDKISAVYGYTRAAATLRRAMRLGPAAIAEAVASLTTGALDAELERSGEYVLLDQLLEIPAQENTGELGLGTPTAPPTPRNLTVLLNPSGQLPAITGYLPVQARTLAPGPVSAAFAKLAFTTRAGPLLVDPRNLSMPLPADIQGQWSFVWRDSVTTWAEQPVANDDAIARLPDRALQLYWGYLRLDGGIVDSTASMAQDARLGSGRFQFLPRPVGPASPDGRLHQDVMNTAQVVPELSYSLSPTAVLINQTMSVQVIATNDTGATIDLGLDSSITVVLPVGSGATDLIVDGSASRVTASVTDPNWTSNVDSSSSPTQVTVQAVPLRATQLANGDSITIVINNVVVNGTTSTSGAELTAQAASGGDQGPLVPLSLPKVESGLTLSAYANPQAVGATQSTSIFWTATGGTQVTLTGNGENQSQNLDGSGPVWTGKFDVKPNQSEAQTIYTVTVKTAGNTDRQSMLVVVDLRPPAITSFTATPNQNVVVTEPVTLTWGSQYGVTAFLSPGRQQVPLQSPDNYQYTPSDSGSSDSQTLTLTVTAPGQASAQSSLQLTFAEVEFVYYSYAYIDDPSKGPSFPIGVANQSSGPSATKQEDGVWTATVSGPGGPLTRTLGAPAPEVRYFGPRNASVSAGSQLTLSYWVNDFAAGDTLVLQPNHVVLTLDDEGKGSTTVVVDEQTDYTLEATLSGVQINNTITVKIES